jgi:hypothetical protein
MSGELYPKKDQNKTPKNLFCGLKETIYKLGCPKFSIFFRFEGGVDRGIFNFSKCPEWAVFWCTPPAAETVYGML